MPIMPAQMRLARHRRAMLDRSEFLDRQGVQFGAEQDGRARRSAVVDRRHAVFSDFRHHLVGSGRCEHLAYPARGFLFFTRQFGMRYFTSTSRLK